MYHGQFEIDKYLHQNFFENVYDGFFVECGAVDGLTESSCLFFEQKLNWTGINIEPVPSSYNLLIQNRPNSINLNYALSDKNEEATFTQANHPQHSIFGNGSLNHTVEHKYDLINQGCSFHKLNVTCKRFADIFTYEREIDLFVLDVEGSELKALDGILDLDVSLQPKVFCIEYPFAGLKEIEKKLVNYNLFSLQLQNAIFVKK